MLLTFKKRDLDCFYNLFCCYLLELIEQGILDKKRITHPDKKILWGEKKAAFLLENVIPINVYNPIVKSSTYVFCVEFMNWHISHCDYHIVIVRSPEAIVAICEDCFRRVRCYLELNFIAEKMWQCLCAALLWATHLTQNVIVRALC